MASDTRQDAIKQLLCLTNFAHLALGRVYSLHLIAIAPGIRAGDYRPQRGYGVQAANAPHRLRHLQPGQPAHPAAP